MKVTFITTVDHNVGDDFVREGLKLLLEEVLGKGKLAYEHIHKHSPITTRHGFESLRAYRPGKVVDMLLPVGLTADRIFEADCVVQSGAPVYWHHLPTSHCSRNEWYKPLINRRFRQRKTPAPLLNLAAGTCQTYHSDCHEIADCPECSAYIRDFFSLSTVTTVRDALAKDMLARMGLQAPHIPCSSIFAAEYHNLKPTTGDYVAVNYMAGGGHFTFGQNIDAKAWESSFSTVYHQLKQRERVVFACHDQKELEQAKKIDPNAEIHFVRHDWRALIEFYAGAKYGLLNRVHGAFMMASLGKPSVVVGSDTRALMASCLGLPSLFVNDASAERLAEELASIEQRAKTSYPDEIAAIRQQAKQDYVAAISKAF